MPSLAYLHPQIVHFAVALLLVGVAFRLFSLTGRLAFTGPAATTLVLLGTIACVLAVRSGTDAHGPVERVPGARAAVMEHEEWGIRARNMAFVVASFELLALMFAGRSPRAGRALAIGAGALGVVGCGLVYLAADHGGQLVYNYAGGVGLRSGNPDDVGHLLVAGLYHEANIERLAGKGPESAALIDMAAARNPQNTELQLVAVEWTTDVRKDPATALLRLDQIAVPTSDNRLRVRSALARAGALSALGNVAAARQVLLTLKGEFPANPQIQRRLDELEKK